MTDPEYERLRRWRLILGADQEGADQLLSSADRAVDRSLQSLYDTDRQGGLGGSSPNVSRWLGDIRSYFPASVVQVLQRDALERLDLRRMLLEPELLAAVEADVHLVGTLLSLRQMLPERTRDTARQVVRKVVEQLLRRLTQPTIQAVRGSLDRASRNNRRPRHHEIDWPRTIQANLKHYQPAYRSIIPERRLGYGRRRSALRDVILCVDQSGSMAASVVYAGIFGAVLASLPALRTQVVAFDTSVVDLSTELDDPVDLLFGMQLGGGTNIAQALSYCRQAIRRPSETIMVLLSDLFEGGDRRELIARAAEICAAGTQLIVLLALNDEGAPAYDQRIAAELAGMGAPVFSCTPDQFPALMAAAIERHDLQQWAAGEQIVAVRGGAIDDRIEGV
jgi:Mg-chelatase subunit ChlD